MNERRDDDAPRQDGGETDPTPPTWVQHLQRRGWRVSVAESMTAGLLANRLACEPDSGDVVAGGIVAYQTVLKQQLLDIGDIPVISEECAAAMAAGCADLCGTEVSVAITGVAGPDTQEGEPVGLVYAAVRTPAGITTCEWRFDGDPDAIRAATVDAAVAALTSAVSVEG